MVPPALNYVSSTRGQEDSPPARVNSPTGVQLPRVQLQEPPARTNPFYPLEGSKIRTDKNISEVLSLLHILPITKK